MGRNIQRLYDMVENAAKGGAKLIVAPEMATTGYQFGDREEISNYVDTVPGLTTDTFAQLARKYDCHIVIGLPEADPETNLYYNTSVLVGPHGYIGKYRKTHLWDAEAHWSSCGNLGVPVFDTEIGKLAMIICMDAYFFETFRLAALRGAEVVAYLTNSSGGAIVNLQARAVENGLFVVSANRSDQELEYTMKGASAVWHPSGKLLAEGCSTGEEIVNATIDSSHFQNRGKLFLEQRRPELYHDLALHTTPWDHRKNRVPCEVTAALCQYEPTFENKDKNMEVVTRLAAKAEREALENGRKLDLLVLPELSFCGSPALLDPDRAINLAEEIEDPKLHGESLVYVSQLAKSLKANVVFGLVEWEANRLYNTAVMLGKDGTVLAKYRKTHLSESDRVWATAGSDFTVVQVEGLGNVGLALGCDAEFPEVATILAVNRADMVVMPSALTGNEVSLIEVSQAIHPYSGKGTVYWDIRARDNCFYLLVANYAGGQQGYHGGSGVYGIDPIYGLDESKFLSFADEGILVAVVRTLPQNWYNQDNFLATRRGDETYYPLINAKF